MSQVKWTCTVCNRSMLANQKQSHIAGKQHKQVVATRQAIPKTPVHNLDNDKWTCQKCDRTMQKSQKLAHINGKLHANKVKSNKRVGSVTYDSDPSDVSYDESDNDEDSYSYDSDEERRREEEQEDGRGILRDIDTQWGAMPWGGFLQRF
jgi:hypothetical protein